MIKKKFQITCAGKATVDEMNEIATIHVAVSMTQILFIRVLIEFDTRHDIGNFLIINEDQITYLWKLNWNEVAYQEYNAF